MEEGGGGVVSGTLAKFFPALVVGSIKAIPTLWKKSEWSAILTGGQSVNGRHNGYLKETKPPPSPTHLLTYPYKT